MRKRRSNGLANPLDMPHQIIQSLAKRRLQVHGAAISRPKMTPKGDRFAAVAFLTRQTSDSLDCPYNSSSRSSHTRDLGRQTAGFWVPIDARQKVPLPSTSPPSRGDRGMHRTQSEKKNQKRNQEFSFSSL
jgi:hypothetical protein